MSSSDSSSRHGDSSRDGNDGDDGGVYDRYGIDKVKGCLVVLRPDQHVGCVLGMEEWGAFDGYLGGVLEESIF